MPTDAPRRFLLAAGTQHYDNDDELTSIPQDLHKVVGFFGRLGYREQLPELRLDPSSTALRRALAQWLNGPDRQPSDTAVIYFSGHGDSQASYFYLLTADTKENRYADTALRTDYVLEALGENPKVRRVLLILDACYAGQGAFDAAGVAARMWPWQNFGADDEGVWVIAAASPKQEAQERLFAEAFIEAAEHLQQTTGTLQPYIGLEALIWQINAILQRRGKHQRASWIPATQARGLAPFIPNLRYEPDAPANVDLETRDWLRRRHAAELAEYWGPKARGVEVAAQAGWYFTGRQAALAELARWLNNPAADTDLRVVTGDPGSGKSAVLGRLVTLAASSAGARPPGAPADLGAIPPAGSIAAVLLARGKTADDLLAELAANLDIADGTDPTGMAITRPAWTVVIDALDEASDPVEVIQKVIVPLHYAASPGYGPRLLVATRRHLLGSLPAPRVTIDLDEEAYRRDTDTAEYVAKMLLAVDDPDSLTPYRGQREFARAVAAQVAAIAGRSFLIAQIAARTLVQTSRALQPLEVSADRERWRDIGTAFDRDLDRYGEQALTVRDLLAPLAWAEGTGLPRELWAPLATALADERRYADEDITWLLGQAGFYLVEALEQDRSVYRLYHEQLAEHLRSARNPRSAQERVTAELLHYVPVAVGGRREWVVAAPYIRAHLAAHAAKARMLDELVNDPGFLLAADSTRLLPALPAVTNPDARKSASAYESIQHFLLGQPPGQAAAQLDISARAHGATRLVDGIDHLPYKRPWTITWGRWAPSQDRHILLGRHTQEIHSVAAATLDGTALAVSGGDDGVRVWDLRTGTVVWEAVSDDTDRVDAVAVGEVDGTPVAVTGGRNGVRVRDLRTGAAYGERLGDWIDAVAVGDVDGIPTAVTGQLNGTVQMWDLRAEAARGGPLGRHGRWMNAVAVGKVDGIPIAVTVGRNGVRMWDLERRARGGMFGRSSGSIYAVAVGELDGSPIAVTGSVNGARVWDLRTRAARGAPLGDYTGIVQAVAIGQVDGIPVAVTGDFHGTLRVYDLHTGICEGQMQAHHMHQIQAVAIADLDGTPVAVTGGHDGAVRIWDLRRAATRRESLDDDAGSFGCGVWSQDFLDNFGSPHR